MFLLEGAQEYLKKSPTLRMLFLDLLPKLRRNLPKILKELGEPVEQFAEAKKDIREAEKMIKSLDRSDKRKLPKSRK